MKRRSTMSVILFVMVIAMFLIDSALYIMDINNTIKEISYTLTSHAAESLADKYALTNNLPWAAESAMFAVLVRFLTASTRSPINFPLSSLTLETLLSFGGYTFFIQ